jgi:hypothetical protein
MKVFHVVEKRRCLGGVRPDFTQPCEPFALFRNAHFRLSQKQLFLDPPEVLFTTHIVNRFDALCGLKSGISHRVPRPVRQVLSKSIISFDFNRESFAATNARTASAT